MNASGSCGQIGSVQVGRIAPLGPEAVPSGFVKTAVTGPVAAGTLGLAGDEQADLSVHGGPDKAVYGYAASRYAEWAADFPALAFAAGSMGENLTIDGADETSVHIGDIHRIGTALLQVTQPRQPCFKLALRFAEPRTVRAMTRSGRSGWYYRVLEAGEVAAGDVLTLVERPNPEWPVARFNAAILTARPDLAIATLAGLAEDWRIEFSRSR